MPGEVVTIWWKRFKGGLQAINPILLAPNASPRCLYSP